MLKQVFVLLNLIFGGLLCGVRDGLTRPLDESVGGLDVSGPGLDVDVDREAAREYDYEREHLPTVRHADGSVADW